VIHGKVSPRAGKSKRFPMNGQPRGPGGRLRPGKFLLITMRAKGTNARQRAPRRGCTEKYVDMLHWRNLKMSQI
jgi:hypothetical protein